MDINLLKKQFNNNIQYQNACQKSTNFVQEETHPFFDVIKAEDKLMGLGRTWEYGGSYYFGESNKKRRMKILRHIYDSKQPRIYHENISSREFCYRQKQKREGCLQLLENFGSFRLEKVRIGKKPLKNSKTSKNSGNKNRQGR